MSVRRARELHRKPTDAENALWRALRSRRLRAFKFRRQHPIAPYIVDFVCLEERLIVEVDGGQHAVEDPTREALLRGRGFRVLRFWNHDVLTNAAGVLEAIAAALEDER